jgi:plastocyanin
MKRAISVVAVVTALTTATSTLAAERTILILEDAYFPQITYLDEGDTVQFMNISGVSQNIIAKNGSWELGPIGDESQVTIVVEPGMQKTFYNKDLTDEAGEYLVEGNMSLAPPPIN